MDHEKSPALTPTQLEVLLTAEVFDEAGKTSKLGDIISGKRVVLIFIRHFCKLSRFWRSYYA